ncbi:MAG: hypothetical protein O3B90_02885 [Actinomycetota bacterium]|uniref:hypothetical protein n=1 Tax=uncultured Ilumatobacter sp. TaxID=879968 RepID=UPI00374F2626|nr:hypothetical protein [Actinomycetota bacterium]
MWFIRTGSTGGKLNVVADGDVGGVVVSAVAGADVDAVSLVVSDSAMSVAAGSGIASPVSLPPAHDETNIATAAKLTARRIVAPGIGFRPL